MAAQGSGNDNFGRGGGGRASGFNPGFRPGFNPGFSGRGRGRDFFPSRGRGRGHGGHGGYGFNGYNSGYHGGARGGRPYGGHLVVVAAVVTGRSRGGSTNDRLRRQGKEDTRPSLSRRVA
jgi:hypothetical protein